MLSLWSTYFVDKIATWKWHKDSPALPSVPPIPTIEAQNRDVYSPEDSDKFAVWRRIEVENENPQSTTRYFWWSKHTGKPLAALLYNAGYSPEIQYRDLSFFYQAVAPFLGSTTAGGKPTWPSFMTDDGDPVELSWDWGTGSMPPKVRYSIEPVGPDAGTSLDPGNLETGPIFQKHLERVLPDMKLEWYHHFNKFFNTQTHGSAKFLPDEVDHNTSIFYAFDLSESSITAKTYFFPKTKAKAYNTTALDIISQAISSAPLATKDNLQAWSVFKDFCAEATSSGIEHEMLAIDHLDPLKSRLKIYFRCRETTLQSVINVMSLGGRIKNSKLHEGLDKFTRLWYGLFPTVLDSTEPLGSSGHRTAGILYNIEFRLGESAPVAKVYLPVRHYARSDQAVIQGLREFFEHYGQNTFMSKYEDTIQCLMADTLSRDSSEVHLGPNVDSKLVGHLPRLHTYIGCAIRLEGSLRVVSYFKPKVSDHVSLPEKTGE